MKPLNDCYFSNYLIREQVILPKDEQDINSDSNYQKTICNKKSSNSSLTHQKNAESSFWLKANSCRLSLNQTNQEKYQSRQFPRPYKIKSNNDNKNNLWSFEGLNTIYENTDHRLIQYIPQSMVIKKGINENLLDIREINNIQQDDISLLNNSTRKSVTLEEKFAEDQEFDIIGILNLSSMNLTDNDIPSVIQKAFCDEKTKCIGLILRDNCLTSVAVKLLVDAIINLKIKLKYLSFSNNSAIGDDGIEHIIRLLQINRSLTFLALPNTGLTDLSVKKLADLLCGLDSQSTCSSLEKLHISFNKLITDQSIDSLIQILEVNNNLKLLNVQHCSLSDKARKKLKFFSLKKKKKKFNLSQ